MILRTDTIAALATPEGEGGIAIVRVSGADAQGVLSRVFQAACGKPPRDWAHARLYYGWAMRDGERVDECMAVLMRAPHSYTREDVAEIHCHGGRMQVRRVLSLLLANGARAAEPGEFTRRAFLNGRIDLSQAEAVMRLISSSSERGSREALRQLEGGVSHFVRGRAKRSWSCSRACRRPWTSRTRWTRRRPRATCALERRSSYRRCGGPATSAAAASRRTA